MPKIEKADNRTNDAGAGQKPASILASVITRFKRMRISRRVLLVAAPVVLVIIALTLAALIIPGRGGNGQLPLAGSTPTASAPNISIPESLVTTNSWMNFYGLECTLDGQPLPVGSVITVRDPEGILCGEFSVTQAGRYGLMPVYGDDLSTQVDEGALLGDSLHFYINGILVTVTGPDEPVWTAMGDLKQVNLQEASTEQ